MSNQVLHTNPQESIQLTDQETSTLSTREGYVTYLTSQNFDVFVTLTFARNPGAKFAQVVRRFFQLLDKEIFGKKSPKKLSRFVVRELDSNQNVHIHMLAHYPFDKISEFKKEILVKRFIWVNDPNYDFDDIKHPLLRNIIMSCWRAAGRSFGYITGTSNFLSDDSADKGCQFIAKGSDSMRAVCDYILKDLKYGKDDHILWEFSVKRVKPTSEPLSQIRCS